MFKLTSLNLNGIRSAGSKGLAQWLDVTRPDCICVQELKAQQSDLAGPFETLSGLTGYFHCAEKKGYAGTAVYTRQPPSAVCYGFGSPEFDAEGRCLELRFDTPQRRLSIISAYFPSGSSGPERQLAKYRFLAAFEPHLRALAAQRELILCGDLNIAHHNIDLKNWKSNQKNSGFLPEERAWLTRLLEQSGLQDVYRRLHPDTGEAAYTWWSNRGQARANNVGWRLDYQIASAAVAQQARSAQVHQAQRLSDHAALTIDYALDL